MKRCHGADRRLADVLYREEVVRARAMAPEDKLLEGRRLFERACRVMCDGIRYRHPDLDDAGVQGLLASRLDRVKLTRAVMTADEAAVAVIDALNHAAIPFMIVGSLASQFHGIPRATRDADFLIQLGSASISDLAAALPDDRSLALGL